MDGYSNARGSFCSRRIQAVFFTHGGFLPADERSFGCITDGVATESQRVGNFEHIGITSPTHPGEEINLALLRLLHDANRSLTVVEVCPREFCGKALSIGTEDGQKPVNVLGTILDQQIHVFSQAT